MISDYWLGGTGGGGWSVLQHLYQSQDYYVKFIHNHYIQTILDVGVIGGLAGLFIIGLFYWNAGRGNFLEGTGMQENESKGILLIVTVMFVHIGFDFDLTYPLIFAMLLTLILLVPSPTWTFRQRTLPLIVATLMVAFAATSFLWLSLGYVMKSNGMRASVAGDFDKARTQLDQAEKWIPWSSTILYESAKNDVRRGNAMKNRQDYVSAAAKMDKAHEMLPKQTLYSDLLEELSIYKN